MIGLSHLISHRFRGFSPIENSVEGLIAALDFGVLNLEFDIRAARCGTPMIYHDEYAMDGQGNRRIHADIMASDFASLGGTFAVIPTAETLLKAAASHPNTDARFLIDIKDGGFEDMIHALVCASGLESRVVYVSWVPNVLYRMFEIAPHMPLCLSHWCQSPNADIRGKHRVHTAKAGIIPRLKDRFIHGERSGWFIDGGARGDMREILRQTGGSVCVPQDMVTRKLVDDYHADNIAVSTFSYVFMQDILQHQAEYNVDLYFVDNLRVFSAL